ncbi:MAG: Ryanodine receptor Ryr [Clostridia bacterium]|nr:Ryanodine receptor Ryr [Clostridia bacterium]
MCHKDYIPQPIDTSRVEVPEELQQLGEYLAKNIHEVWAQQRLSEGWTYGPMRDADKKQHPDLIPYEALTECEKQYDRNTSMETIRVILSLGYRIVRDEG